MAQVISVTTNVGELNDLIVQAQSIIDKINNFELKIVNTEIQNTESATPTE